ncbi:MAG: hypothetical protein EOO88_08515 [Pedobacter sp.]|nr:MAG: hypothetical protein EOO88_08515 [Pedobacter sp.]
MTENYLNHRKPSYRLLLISAFALLSLLNFSCKKDAPKKSNLTGISAFSLTGHDAVVFAIDQNALTISNVDSLPFNTSPAALIAKFTSVNNSAVTVNSVAQVSGTTPNNFAQTVTYQTTAEDGVTVRSYAVKVNIAKVDPKTVAWKQLTANGGYGPYRTLTAGVLNNKFFAFGTQGVNTGTFSSNDGITWTTVTATDNNAAVVPVAERQTAVFGFKNKVWLLGGHVPGAGFSFSYVTNSVWSSADGITWTATPRVVTPVGDNIWEGRERIGATVFQDKLWVIGGNRYPSFGNVNSNGVPLNDVWSSADGAAWTKVTAAAQFTARSNPSVLTHKNKLYVIGGKNASNTLLDEIWTSADGATWTQLTVATKFTGRWGHQVVSFNNNLFLIGGRTADGIQNDLWVSEDDGVNWTKITAGDPRVLPGTFTGRAYFSAFVHQSAIWIIGGEFQDANGYTYRNDTWKGSLVK